MRMQTRGRRRDGGGCTRSVPPQRLALNSGQAAIRRLFPHLTTRWPATRREPPLISASIVLEELNEPLAPSPELAPTSSIHRMPLYARRPASRGARRSECGSGGAGYSGRHPRHRGCRFCDRVEQSRDGAQGGVAHRTELRLPPLQPSASLLSRRPTEDILYNRSHVFPRARH